MNNVWDDIIRVHVLELVKEWKEGATFEFPDNNDLDSVDKLLKLSHYYEVEARKTAEFMPQDECIMVCMMLYSYIVYISPNEPISDSIYNTDYLHIYALEAIRLLQYNTCRANEEAYSLSQMILLLRQIQNMILIREIAKRLHAGLILRPEEIAFRNGIELSKEDTNFMRQCGQNFSGKGKRFRMAVSTTSVLMDSLEGKNYFLYFLDNLLVGVRDEKSLKKISGSYFEFFPVMKIADEDFESYSKFLKQIIGRIKFIRDFMNGKDKWKCDIIEGENIPKDMVYEPQFKRWKIADEERIELFQTPIVKLSDDRYVTCFELCGDSMNSWIERELYSDYETCGWKNKILQQIETEFENEVNQFMRDNGYRSGRLKENGEWCLENEMPKKEKLPITIPGECDVFAVNDIEKKIFILECKRFHDVTISGASVKTMEDIRKKVLHKFIPKLSKKREKIESVIQRSYPKYEVCTAIVTDVDFPIYIKNDKKYKWKDEISYCSFETLKRAVKVDEFPKSALFIQENEKGVVAEK